MGKKRAYRPAKICASCGQSFWRDTGAAAWARTFHCSVKCGKASKRKAAVDRIWDTCIPEPNSGCWLWLGTMTQWGYAQIMTRRGVTGFAHRYSFEAFKGPLPPGKLACHTCDNRMCVNPDHIYAGTYADNSSDAVRRGRTLTGSRNHRAKLSEDDVRIIMADGRMFTEIAGDYGVTRTAISAIKNKRTWGHLWRT